MKDNANGIPIGVPINLFGNFYFIIYHTLSRNDELLVSFYFELEDCDEFEVASFPINQQVLEENGFLAIKEEVEKLL